MATLLSINNYFYRRGGAEVVFLEQNRLFEEAGWKVVPFSMQHKDNYETEWSKYFVDEIEFGEKYSLLEKLVRVPKTVYSFEAKRKLRSLLLSSKPDVCHAHNIYHHISPSILSVLKSAAVPTVLTLHDLKIACPAYKMLNKNSICEKCKNGNLHNVVVNRCVKDSLALSFVVMLESMINNWLKSYADNVERFVVPSRFYMNKFIEWGWPPDKFVYVPNFIDVEVNVPTNNVGKKYLYFGRLAPEKGLATFIKAVARARVSAMIIGAGPDEQSLKQLAESLGADVMFPGYRTGVELREAVCSSRAVVLPSEWYENAPISLLEAYSMGKPVIGARIGGIPELVREGETGHSFESASVEDLAQKLEQYEQMSDASLLDMGRNARQWAESDFTKARYRERLLGLYKQMGVSV